MYDQREVVLIPFPYSDLTGSKRRPALIISNKTLNNTEDRICCLITSNLHKDDVTINKNDFMEGDLPFKSAIRSHRIFTIDSGIVLRKLCTVKKELYNKVISRIEEFICQQKE